MVIDSKGIITYMGIRKKNITNTMRGVLVDNCPLSYSSKICHPSCNWWSGIRCTYPASVPRKA